MNSDDGWHSTTYAGNAADQLSRNLSATYEQRFRWLVDTYEFMKQVLPPRQSELNDSAYERRASVERATDGGR
jgi:hypothetical protein